MNQLSDEEKQVLINKGTERPFSGKYTNTTQEGIYTCKLCGSPLYKSTDKFQSHCGWPSFDDAIKGAVKRIPDSDGRRVEIVCAKCGGHLGHVFEGEGYTKKDTRYCVNSISLNFYPKSDEKSKKYEKAYFSGGCFWGVEYYLEKLKGVQAVHSGFMGGKLKNPTYTQVVHSDTGHLETVEVLYDRSLISYEQLVKAFFEIHDPTQTNGQGPDIGDQYLSAVFVNNEGEKKKVRELIAQLNANGFKVATKILEVQPFYKAEEYHQDYYRKKGSKPYCHAPVKRF
ncbi:MAG TPA: bifunctional methionine sulfoxide reductase B/A protein [Sulfuricurvum sp.]|nr:bifunctional methionine sulfoxide reductase B/A protein [Sulfuricurvum sp.]